MPLLAVCVCVQAATQAEPLGLYTAAVEQHASLGVGSLGAGD